MLYRVESEGGGDLGSLEQGFVDGLVEGMSSFLLAGRAWAVEQVSHADRTVRVRPAPRGSRPTWGGFVPQLLGFELCRRIRRVLTGDDRYPYLDPAAGRVLESRREALGALLRNREPAIEVEDGTLHWWTFAGGRVNHTLKHVLQATLNVKVVADNLALRVEPAPAAPDLERTLAELDSDAFWSAEPTTLALLARLPAYRLSKFQRCLPAALSAETVGRYLLDVPGTRRFLRDVRSGNR